MLSTRSEGRMPGVELVVTWKKAVVAAVLAAAGVVVYCRFFRGVSSMGTDELFAEYMKWNPVAEHELRKRKKEHPVSRLKGYLSHERTDVKVLAAELLGRPGDLAALDVLAEAVDDASSEVRAQAAESLGEIGVKEEVIPILASMLDDEDPEVLTAVLRALKGVTGQSGVHGVDGWKTWWDMHKARY